MNIKKALLTSLLLSVGILSSCSIKIEINDPNNPSSPVNSQTTDSTELIQTSITENHDEDDLTSMLKDIKGVLESKEKAKINVEESNKYIKSKFKIKLKNDDSQYLYYQLVTNKGYSGNVEISILVKNSEVIAYIVTGGTEDSLGIDAAKKLLISVDHPYKLGEELKCGVTAGKTLPQLKLAIDAALADAKIKDSDDKTPSVFPKNGTATEQLNYIWKRDLEQKTDLKYVEVSSPKLKIDNTEESKVDKKLNFTFDGKNASFYLVSFVQMDLYGNKDEGKFTAVVNKSGVINFHSIMSSGMLSQVMKPLEKLCTVETPYKASRADEVTQAGVTVSSTLMQSALSLLIEDFNSSK